MPQYLNPDLTVAQAGPVLEQEFLQRFGQEEYKRLYRTLDLQMQEHLLDQDDQILGVLTLIGKAVDQTNLFLALIWLSKKEMADPLGQAMLRELRAREIGRLLEQARQSVSQESQASDKSDNNDNS